MNRFDRDRFDQMGKEALSRVEELMNSSRINELLHKREEDEKKKNCILWVLAIIGAVAAVAGIAYAVYRFFTPDYLEDFEDDLDRNGFTEQFQQGERQVPYDRKRPAADLYNTMNTGYQKIIKQLTDLLPDDKKGSDDLLDFLGGDRG